MGRPTDLTPALQKKIVAMVRDGVSPEVAAVAAGVNRATYYRWQARGREEETGLFRDFCDAVEKAIAQCEARAIRVVQRAFPTSWQAAMTLLERRFSDRWSRRDRLDVSVTRKEAEKIAAEFGLNADEVMAEAERIVKTGVL